MSTSLEVVIELEKSFEHYYKLMINDSGDNTARTRAVLSALGLIAAKAEISLEGLVNADDGDDEARKNAVINLAYALEDCGKISALVGKHLLDEQSDNESEALEEDTPVP